MIPCLLYASVSADSSPNAGCYILAPMNTCVDIQRCLQLNPVLSQVAG